MANIYEGMNVRQKLAKARLYFLNQKIKKSGKNMHLEFKYFELETLYPRQSAFSPVLVLLPTLSLRMIRQ